MEDPEIGGMDGGSIKRWFSRLYHQVWRRRFLRSGWMTGFLLASVLIGLTLGYRQHMRGNFHKLKEKMADERVDAPVPRPGGQEAVTLSRTRLAGDETPEFLSMTLLPGRGMNVLQITAYIPGEGEVNLLASPTVPAAAAAMTGTGADAGGRESLTMGGAFEAPWAGRIWGTAAQNGRMNTMWQGHTITLRATGNGSGNAIAQDGLMLAEPSDEVRTLALPDGGDAEAMFHSRDFGAQWPSQTDVSITVLLNSRSIDLTMEARNAGNEPEPIGLGWAPRFAIVDGNREQLRLRIPSETWAEIHRDKGAPTGALVPVKGTPYDFLTGGGAALGTVDLDDCFVDLQQNLLDNGPFAEMNDPASNFGLRLTALSSAIKAMRVDAPVDGNYVSIEPQYNYPDPFGREWKNTDTGMVVLQPGQSTRWRVRLEIYALTGNAASM